jgi:hypothetical protein
MATSDEPMAASDESMANSDEPRLLSLPMELLTRVTDRLNDKSLSTLRLACKTLEGATFRRFTKVFATSYCCVYYEARWLSLEKFLHGPFRLVRNLKCIDFTTDPLEGHHYTQMQIAPGESFDDIRTAQEQFTLKEANEDEPYEPLDADRQAMSTRGWLTESVEWCSQPTYLLPSDTNSYNWLRIPVTATAQLDVLTAFSGSPHE